jgi:hypothetical protein
MIMYGDLEKTGKEAILTYVKVIPWHSPGDE